MTTFLLVLAGVGALATGTFALLWRSEKRKRKTAETQRDNAVARATANEVLVRELRAAAAEAEAAEAELEKEREKQRKHIEAIRKRLEQIGSGEDIADEWNEAMGSGT